jgi:phytoene dehydrogenase-like protein
VNSGDEVDALVIGGGHNGLVTAAYLAKAGLATLVLERRDEVGGALVTADIAPGIRAPTLAHTVGRLRRSVITDLGLLHRGLRLIRPEARVFVPRPDGRSITLWDSVSRTADGLRAWSAGDAEGYPSFDRRVRSLASFMAYLHVTTPPHLKSPSLADAFGGLRMGRAYRELSPRARREVFRVLPMAVADFVAEAIETPALRGVLATRGVQYAALGPWSAGTTAVLLADSAGNDGGAPGQTVYAEGGPGALASALVESVRAFGGEVRTGADVVAVTESGRRATGVALASGEEIRARVVVSGVDPKRTLLRFLDPVTLGPSLVWRAGNIRTPGVVSKVNLAMSGLPAFSGVEADAASDPRLHGRIVIAPSVDHVERAFDASKYGRISEEPYLEAVIPTLSDPTLAPEGTHVMSVLVQWTPYRLRDGAWDAEREGLGDLVLKTLEAYAPGLSDLVTARQVVTPLDLERDIGMTDGHPLHGEPGLDDFFAWRPLLGHARYRMPLAGYYLCGSGAHPGGGVTGAPGANAAREILVDLRRDR